MANAVLFPEIDVNGAAGRSRASTRTGTLPPGATLQRNNFQLSASTSFELDFWGRHRRAPRKRRAAQGQWPRAMGAMSSRFPSPQTSRKPTSTWARIRRADHRVSRRRSERGRGIASIFAQSASTGRRHLRRSTSTSPSALLRSQFAAQTEGHLQRPACGTRSDQLGVLTNIRRPARSSAGRRALSDPLRPPHAPGGIAFDTARAAGPISVEAAATYGVGKRTDRRRSRRAVSNASA